MAPGGSVAIAFVEDGRPFLAIVDDGAPRLLALEGEARAIAVDFDGAKALVVAADGDGLYAVNVTSHELAASPPVRHVERGDVRAPLRIERVGDARLVFYALSDAALGVLFFPKDGGARDVRYAIPAPCVHLGTASGSRHAAVALAYDGDEVHRALFDAEGRTIERPHAALHVPGARFVSAQALWATRRFSVGGIDASTGACILDGEPGTTLEGFGPGPLALVHRKDQWLGLQLAVDGPELGVGIRTVGADDHGEGGVRWFSPEGSALRDARRRSAELLTALHGELARASYRDPGSITVDAGSLTMRLGEGRSGLVLRFAPEPPDLGLELELEDPSYEHSFVDRVARMWTGEARGAEKWEAWAWEIVDGVVAVTGIAVLAEKGRRVVRLGLSGFPTGGALSELVRRARKRVNHMR